MIIKILVWRNKIIVHESFQRKEFFSGERVVFWKDRIQWVILQGNPVELALVCPGINGQIYVTL